MDDSDVTLAAIELHESDQNSNRSRPASTQQLPNMDDSGLRLPERAPPTLARRDACGFFFAGLSNNMSYVIMIAGAKSIAPSLVGLVYVW